MADPVYLSESGVITNVQPGDIIPEDLPIETEYSAPVVIRELGSGLLNFENTSITGSFYTNDDTVNSCILFISGYRRGPNDGEDTAHYYDGYGIAVRPLTAEGIASGQNNVFVYDNNVAAAHQVVLENVLHTGWGDYAYLAATSAEIVPDTWYNFMLSYGPGGTLEFYVWQQTSTMGITPTISYGSYQPQSSGTYWGVGASQTRGYQWKLGDLNLYSNLDNYAMLLCKMSSKNFTDQATFKAYAIGWGWDTTAEEEAPGIELYIYNQLASEWELKDQNELDIFSGSYLLSSGDLDLDYYAEQITDSKYIYAMLVSKWPAKWEEYADSWVQVDYAYLENWNTSGAHVGGMGDVYVRETASPQYNYIDLLNVDYYENIDSDNAHLVGTLYLPMLWIRNVEILDAFGNPTGLTSTYVLSVLNETTRFSSEEALRIYLPTPGANYRIHYYTFTNIASAQAYVDDEFRRNTTEDYMIKAYTPVEVSIVAEYTGGEVVDIRSALTSWINSSDMTSISRTDVAAKIQEQLGVTDATCTSLEAIIHAPNGSDENLDGNDPNSDPPYTITIGDRQAFAIIGDTAHISLVAT